MRITRELKQPSPRAQKNFIQLAHKIILTTKVEKIGLLFKFPSPAKNNLS